MRAMRTRLRTTSACLATVVLLSGCSLLRSHDDSQPAQLDTMVKYKMEQYVSQFPWSADMMNELQHEGLLISPERVFELQTYFQMACVGGQDMLAGQPDRTAADLAEEFHVTVSAESAQRLNDAQKRLCAAMPLQMRRARTGRRTRANDAS